MGIYLKILAFTAFVIGAAAFLPAQKACAGAGQIAQQTCDAEVWRDMTNRARIETEREVMQNQNLIFKPDSIMAYTCFDRMASHIAATAGALFTHTGYWTPMPIAWGSSYALDTAMNNVVRRSLGTWFNSNFQHSMLGGRGGIEPLSLPLHPTTETVSTASQSSLYVCSVMAQVWQTAKCLNFLHTDAFANTDGYYPFIDIQGLTGDAVPGYSTVVETRRYPAAMSCAQNADPLGGSTWEEVYRQSRNETGLGSPNQHYLFGENLRNTFRDVRARVAPFGSTTGTGTASCSSPIRTGISIILAPGATQTYPDGVCSNPGCTYFRAGGGSCSSSSAATPSTGAGGDTGPQ